MAVALSLEERETCPECGWPKAICRSSDVQFTDFDVQQEECHVARRLAEFRASDGWKAKHDTTRASTMLAAHFREGQEPNFFAGLGLGAEYGDQPDDGADNG